LNKENSHSSEDSSSNELQVGWGAQSSVSDNHSPITKERLKYEKKYHKKM